MANVNHYYEALLQAQKHYLIAMHKLAIEDPFACSKVFDMKPSHVSSLTKQTVVNWTGFVSELKNWVLTPKKDLNEDCLFEYFINNIYSYESIVKQVNARTVLGRSFPDDLECLSTISKYQSAIFQNICLCVQEAPLFTKGLLFLDQTTIDLISKFYITSNKLHFVDSFIPLFVVNEAIDYATFFNVDSKARQHVEQTLFSIVA
jgi:hypothetical protein